MNEWKCSDLKCVQKPTRVRISLTHFSSRFTHIIHVRPVYIVIHQLMVASEKTNTHIHKIYNKQKQKQK